jgi:hypothetical protein
LCGAVQTTDQGATKSWRSCTRRGSQTRILCRPLKWQSGREIGRGRREAGRCSMAPRRVSACARPMQLHRQPSTSMLTSTPLMPPTQTHPWITGCKRAIKWRCGVHCNQMHAHGDHRRWTCAISGMDRRNKRLVHVQSQQVHGPRLPSGPCSYTCCCMLYRHVFPNTISISRFTNTHGTSRVLQQRG